jgi:hypothetical protein
VVLAERLLKENTGTASRLQAAWRLILSRPPTADELAAAEKHLVSANAKLAGSGSSPELDAWASLVRVMFRLNEFLYLD